MINFHKIDQLKKRLDSHRPLAPEIVNNLREDLLVRWTYNSNAWKNPLNHTGTR